MENMDIELIMRRGDILSKTFSFKIGGDTYTEYPDEIYFTVKKNYSTQDFVLQKKKSTGGITVSGKDCVLVLSHNDTAQLSYGNYVYDIQFKSGDYVKTICMGTITLTNESTWKANE